MNMMHDFSRHSAVSAYHATESHTVAQFRPLVQKLAWQMAGTTAPFLDVDDLLQIGLIALLECSRRHDRPTRDGFPAYVKLRVRGAMIDAARQAQADRRTARANQKRLDEAAAALAASTGVDAHSDADMCRQLGCNDEQLRRMRAHVQPIRHEPLDTCYDDQTLVFAGDDPGAESLLIAVESQAQLAAAIAALPERQQLIVQLYFLEELNLSEIGQVLGVSVPRVHQLKAAALAGLRKMLDAE